MLKKEFFFNKINYFVILFFTTIFLTLWPLIKDYGVTLDDFIYYVNGEKTYLYVKSLFLSFFDNNIDPSQYRAALKEYPTIYELFLVLICKILGVNDFHLVEQVSGAPLSSAPFLRYLEGKLSTLADRGAIALF